MAETQNPKRESSCKRERLPISVPFIWEDKPGIPKKDWKPSSQPAKPPPPPVKYVVSVPFGWEAKPGTPLSSFTAQEQEHSEFLLLHPKYAVTGDGGKDERGYNEAEESSDSELDTCSVETDDTFSSAKSLLANGLISTAAISSAVPLQQTSLALTTAESGLLQSPGSPGSETDSISSYATGTTSLAGASFLEWLFPLLVTNSNGVNKGGYLENAHSLSVDLHGSQVKRPPLLTLGELIAMSRRRSCQRKVNKMHKQQSMDFMKRNLFSCCISGAGNRINQLQLKWKRQLQLKLM